MKRILYFLAAVLFVSNLSAEIIKKPIITLNVAKKNGRILLKFSKRR